MIRRLFKTGNSIVLSLSKEMLDYLGIKNGDYVNLVLDSKQKRLMITPFEKSLVSSGVDDTFAHQVAEFIKIYRPAQEELAK